MVRPPIALELTACDRQDSQSVHNFHAARKNKLHTLPTTVQTVVFNLLKIDGNCRVSDKKHRAKKMCLRERSRQVSRAHSPERNLLRLSKCVYSICQTPNYSTIVCCTHRQQHRQIMEHSIPAVCAEIIERHLHCSARKGTRPVYS